MNDDSVALKKSLGELIAEQLKEDIYERKIEFGNRLIEADLAERFDVSRSTIREALKILEQEELVISKARKGTFVAKFTDKDLQELTEVRILIETKAFVKALAFMKEEHYQELEMIINQMRKEAEQKNWNNLFELDLKFHQYVINLCGNSKIIKIYDFIQVQIRVYVAHLDHYYSSAKSYFNEHKELFDALRKKDETLVKKQIEHHIAYVEQKVLQLNQ